MIRVAMSGLFGFGEQLRARMGAYEILRGYHMDLGRAAAWDPARATDSWCAACADSRVQAVVIASPTPRHATHIIEAFEHNRAVYVEKPMVSWYVEVEGVRRAWDRAGRPPFMVGHKARRAGAARAIRRVLDDGRLGIILKVIMDWSHGGGFALTEKSWRFWPTLHREGPLQTLGVHLIDLLHYWFGPVLSVYATIQNRAGVTAAPDSNAVLLTMGTGIQVFLSANYVQPSQQRIEIVGTEGLLVWESSRLWIREGRDAPRRWGVEGHWPAPARPLPYTENDPIQEELDEFARAVEEGGPIVTGFEVGAEALRVLEACWRSAGGHRPVTINEVVRDGGAPARDEVLRAVTGGQGVGWQT